MPTRSPSGAPLVDTLNDSPRDDLPSMLEDFASWVDGRSVPTYADAAARNAALAGLGPSDRRLAVTRNDSTLWMWTGSAWAVAYRAGGGAWTTFAPAWTSWDGTNEVAPNVGTGSVSGRYVTLGPKTCAFRLEFERGANTQQGAGSWRFTAPFKCAGFRQHGPAVVYIGGAANAATAAFVTTNTFKFSLTMPPTAGWIGSATRTWNAGDTVSVGPFVYETE